HALDAVALPQHRIPAPLREEPGDGDRDPHATRGAHSSRSSTSAPNSTVAAPAASHARTTSTTWVAAEMIAMRSGAGWAAAARAGCAQAIEARDTTPSTSATTTDDTPAYFQHSGSRLHARHGVAPPITTSGTTSRNAAATNTCTPHAPRIMIAPLTWLVA